MIGFVLSAVSVRKLSRKNKGNKLIRENEFIIYILQTMIYNKLKDV